MTMAIKTVLCPVDFSDTSRKALRHAAAVATWYEAVLHVVHVIADPSGSAVSTATLVPVEATTDLRARAGAAVREFVDASDISKTPAREVVRTGDPAAEILEYSRDISPDLLVMGTHGRTGLRHALMGSTTERVVQHAASPVLTIPRDAGQVRSPALIQFKRILCACDFSPSSDRAVDYARSLAQENYACLTLLHTVETLVDAQAIAAADQRVVEYVQSRTQDAHARLHALAAADTSDSCETSERVELGAPAQTILRIADELHADLIVMGAQGHVGIGVVLFGSTTHTVLRRATCPVLTARAVS
jgi:nucleotide-binding universal stress UspA family protein